MGGKHTEPLYTAKSVERSAFVIYVWHWACWPVRYLWDKVLGKNRRTCGKGVRRLYVDVAKQEAMPILHPCIP